MCMVTVLAIATLSDSGTTAICANAAGEGDGDVVFFFPVSAVFSICSMHKWLIMKAVVTLLKNKFMHN